MMKIVIIVICLLGLVSCGDDFENCQTCESSQATGAISSEYCQDGSNVQSTVDGVVTTIENTTVEAVVATQLTLEGVTCN